MSMCVESPQQVSCYKNHTCNDREMCETYTQSVALKNDANDKPNKTMLSPTDGQIGQKLCSS
jgi:hypothetical protein